jgi:hypothetical protein
MLHLAIALWVSNGCIAYFGSRLVAIILKFLAGELRAEIGDYAVRHTEMAHNPSDVLYGSLSNESSDRFNLHPLCELVDGDQ